MATTTNFGWETPDDTDLVKDGAAAMRTLGNSIDTSLVDLKGGTTGQVLSKASNTDMDFSWTSIDPLTILDAKGDLISATAADTPARLAVGTNGQILSADSSTSTGLKWITPSTSTSGLTFISRTTFSNVASQAIDSVFSSSYYSYLIAIEGIYSATAADDLQLQFRYAGPTTETTQYYGSAINGKYNETTVSNYGTNNAAALNLSKTSAISTLPIAGFLYVSKVGNASEAPVLSGTLYEPSDASAYTVGGNTLTARTYTGFLLKSSSSNITGAVSVYGVAKS